MQCNILILINSLLIKLSTISTHCESAMLQFMFSLVSLGRETLLFFATYTKPNNYTSDYDQYYNVGIVTLQYIGVLYFMNSAAINIRSNASKSYRSKISEFLDLKHFSQFVRNLIKQKIDILNIESDRRQQLGFLQFLYGHVLLFRATSSIRDLRDALSPIQQLTAIFEILLHTFLFHYLSSRMNDELLLLYEKKRAFALIVEVLDSSNQERHLIGLGKDRANVLLVQEISKLVHKNLDFTSLEASANVSIEKSQSTSKGTNLNLREISQSINAKDEVGVKAIEKISVEFEEFESYFLTIFDSR